MTKLRTPLYFKHMVCDRCLKVARHALTAHGIEVMEVRLGEVVLPASADQATQKQVRDIMQAEGFEPIDQPREQLINHLKRLVIAYVRPQDDQFAAGRPLLSAWLTERMGYEYSYLSQLFSSVEGRTLERFYIAHRIERAKELLTYEEYTLGTIADMLGYGSASHFSRQFRSETGLTPTHFRRVGQHRRLSLDRV